MATSHLSKFVHGLLCDARYSCVVWIHCFAHLKIYIRVLGGAAQHRMFRREGTGSMGTDQVLVEERAEFFIRKLKDFVDFMRSAETVEEMQEGDPRLESCGHGDGSEIMRFL